MCGVFGFVSNDSGAGPDLLALRDIAVTTQTRGRHAFGFAWVDSRGVIKSYRSRGRIADDLGVLAMAADARLLIGHCRFATKGDPFDNINNHPHPADGGWIVHNGMLRQYQSLLWAHGLEPVSECDSEVLGLLVEKFDGSFMDRCRAAVRAVSSKPLVMMGLWSRPERLVVIRDGNPLCVSRHKGAYYLGSLADGLPGKVEEFPDQTAMEFTVEGEETVAAIPPPPAKAIKSKKSRRAG